MCPRKSGSKSPIVRQTVADRRAELQTQLGKCPGLMEPVVVVVMLDDAACHGGATAASGSSSQWLRQAWLARGHDDPPHSANPGRRSRPESRDREELASVREIVQMASTSGGCEFTPSLADSRRRCRER